MKFTKHILTLGTLAVFTLSAPAMAEVKTGEAAPDFTTNTANGEKFHLNEHKGKIVILEWTNNGCPFVRKHYDVGNMQKIQAEAHDYGDVEWVTVISSAEGKQGYLDADGALRYAKVEGWHADEILLDPAGDVGKLYGAQTTPHMYIIDEEGTLVYQGAIDDKPSPSPKTIEGAHNYVLAALEDLKAGRAVETATTKPYGCAVKY
ncbi:MAG: redoxin domain-containing protein [Micavibrio sp.]|nr:redoxin domain-containing protein [Micavibrio sp.]